MMTLLKVTPLAMHVPAVLVDAQYVAAGLTLQLAIQSLLGWRRRRDDRASLWFGLSTASMSGALLANIWLFKAPPALVDSVLLLRTVLLMSTVVLQAPTVAAFVHRRVHRRVMQLVVVLCACRVLLWLSTDLVYAHRIGPDGAPEYGEMLAALSLPLLGLVVGVVVSLARSSKDRVERSAFLVGVTIGLALAIVSVVTSNAPLAELLRGYCLLPLIVALQVVSTRRIALAERTEQQLASQEAAMTMELARTERRSRLALSAGGMGWYEWDPTTRLLETSPEFAALLGIDPELMPSTIDGIVPFVHPDDRAGVMVTISGTPTSGIEAAQFRWQRDDELVWIEANGRTVVGPDGRTEVVGVARDITDRKAVEQELRHLAQHDPLTGLPNRTTLSFGLRDALDRGEPFALLLMDLDGFKDVNDTLGHPVGDQVLIAVARRLALSRRTPDLLARIGGDEFALIVADRPQAAEQVAERLLASLQTPVDVDGVAITVRASIGIVHGPADGADADTLLRRADAAMYRAKARGGAWHQYAQDDDHGATRRLQLAGQLEDALATSQIEVHYQPTIQLPARDSGVVEALVRWRHPEHGLVSPIEFVPLAEQYGLGLALARFVLDGALATCAGWRADRLASSVAVNVSPHTLLDPAFVGHVATALTQARLPAEALVLELTENAFAEDADALLRSLDRLRDLGVRLAIDDFGTGYSSLAYLERLPVHTVKLDRAFAAGLSSDGANDAIVALSIEMAHRLDLTVVAEGVETPEALAALERYGCDAAQGYFVCRPAPAYAITAWLVANRNDCDRRRAPEAPRL